MHDVARSVADALIIEAEDAVRACSQGGERAAAIIKAMAEAALLIEEALVRSSLPDGPEVTD